MSGTTRDYTRFFTLPETAQLMVNLLNLQPNDHVLEPSAGNGALVRMCKYYQPKCQIDAVEIDSQWYMHLCDAGAKQVFRDDFLYFKPGIAYDKIIANPPFGNGTDVQAHFDKMWSHLKIGGLIACILPKYIESESSVLLKEMDLPPHISYPLANWATNKDGTITEIHLILAQKSFMYHYSPEQGKPRCKSPEFLG